jgi:peptidoglycan-associated lipoprotein
MRSRILLVLLAALPLIFAGCASEPTKHAPVEEKSAEPAAPAETSGAEQQGGVQGKEMSSRQAELLAQRRVFFAFDSSNIDDDSRAVIEAHAANLVANPSIKVRLEGNCDERGTREYNLALGERRAKAVAELMRALGVGADRITTVSYGEEKPVALEHNESAWRQNRRVDIVY